MSEARRRRSTGGAATAIVDQAETLLRALRALDRRRKRRSLDEIWRVFRATIRGYTAEAEARKKVATLLGQMEAAGALGLPRGKRSWDDSAQPALPRWVQLADIRRRPVRVDHRRIAWPPELAFVTGLRTVACLDELLAIKRFFAEGGRKRPSVPLRERSVELFGDEKRLEQLSKARLFGPGRLSLAQLRCHDVAPPLVFEVGPPNAQSRMLVIENLHTYQSVREVNARAARYRLVAYGQGNSFSKTAADLPRLCAAFDIGAVSYFGDLDLEGLRIPRRAQSLLADLPLGPTIEPAGALYAILLEQEDRLVRPPPRACEVEPSLIAWLPDTLQVAARALLRAGRRLPQELVGYELLSQAQKPW